MSTIRQSSFHCWCAWPPIGAVVFTIPARPAFESGSVQEWAEYLAAQQNLTIDQLREARVNRMPCIVIEATMPSEMGPMRSRFVFLEDGRRLFNIGTLAPEAIWPSVRAGIGDELARDNPEALFLKMEILGLPCLAIRDLSVDGVLLDQA